MHELPFSTVESLMAYYWVRYWVRESYEAKFQAGENPENIDKEFLRLWFRDHCDPYKDEVPPNPDPDPYKDAPPIFSVALTW